MDPFALLVIIFGVVGVVVFTSWHFSKRRRILRAMRKVPVTPIRDVTDRATARIVGTLGYASQPLVAPLSGRPCAAYEVVVEELRRRGKSSTWVRVIHEALGQPFYLRDGTGKAIIHPYSDHIAIVQDTHKKSGMFNDASPELEAYLSRHGRSSQGWVFNKNIRYHEGVLEEGELVSVLGVAAWEADPQPDAGGPGTGYREAPRRLVLTSSGETKLHISDDPQVTARDAASSRP